MPSALGPDWHPPLTMWDHRQLRRPSHFHPARLVCSGSGQGQSPAVHAPKPHRELSSAPSLSGLAPSGAGTVFSLQTGEALRSWGSLDHTDQAPVSFVLGPACPLRPLPARCSSGPTEQFAGLAPVPVPHRQMGPRPPSPPGTADVADGSCWPASRSSESWVTGPEPVGLRPQPERPVRVSGVHEAGPGGGGHG